MRHLAIAAILACAAALPAAADPVAGLWRTEPGDEGGYLFVREKKVAIWLAMRTSLSGDIAFALHDPVGVTENLDLRAAREGGQRDPRPFGEAQRMGRGRGDRDDRARPAIAAFCTISTETRLVMTKAPPEAGTPSRASAPISLSSALCRPTSSRAWVMPLPGCRSPRHGPRGQVVDRLMGAERVARPRHLGHVEPHACGTTGKLAHRLRQAVDPAKPAAHRPQHRAAAFAQRLRPRLGDPEPRLDPVRDLQRLDALDLVRRRPRSPRSARSPREILDIRRARHHHGLRGAVHGDRDRRLLGQRAGDLPPLAAHMGLPPGAGGDARYRPGFIPPPEGCAAPVRPVRRSPSATRSARSTATPAPPSPCIPGSSWPSRNNPW
jgi:hypothetical protein